MLKCSVKLSLQLFLNIVMVSTDRMEVGISFHRYEEQMHSNILDGKSPTCDRCQHPPTNLIHMSWPIFILCNWSEIFNSVLISSMSVLHPKKMNISK